MTRNKKQSTEAAMREIGRLQLRVRLGWFDSPFPRLDLLSFR